MAVLAVTAFAHGRAQERCPQPAATGVAYSLDLDVDRDRTGSDVTAAFTLLEAAADHKDVAMLLFADGIQVLGPDTVQTVPCDATARWTVRLPAPEGTPLDLHATAHTSPRLPEAVADTDPDDPSERPLVELAYDAEDVNTVAFGPPRAPPPEVVAREAERRAAPLADAYLYDDDPTAPVAVRVLEPGITSWSFGIWFAETWRRDGTFALTCTVDDRQIDAFGGKPLWFATLDHGEAALIEARTPELAPGWHQVRCLVLDDLFTGAERGVAWPYVIRSTFVHRRP